MCYRFSMVCVVAAGLLTVGIAHAQVSNVFNMPNGEASLQFVSVGSPGNAADPNTGSLYGSVSYVYQMGKYDVTVGQYCQFLNAVAATDTYGLYNSYMATYFSTVGIVQGGSPGSYTYSVSYNTSAWNSYATNYPGLFPSALAAAANCPVFAVTWGDAARFCNWLQNGQPTDSGEAANSTEKGAYTLNGATSYSQLMAVSRNGGASYFIPSENEWYKAAFYDPTGGTYWTYATQSNTVPTNVLSATGTNNANYNDAYDSPHTGNGGYTDRTNYLTPVGVFAASPGPYGTYDMGGDMYQWTETNYDNLNEERVLRGDPPTLGSTDLVSSFRGEVSPTDEGHYVGFRVASVPEPGSIPLLVCGAVAALIWWRRRT